jgi:hypothetical protein
MIYERPETPEGRVTTRIAWSAGGWKSPRWTGENILLRGLAGGRL